MYSQTSVTEFCLVSSIQILSCVPTVVCFHTVRTAWKYASSILLLLPWPKMWRLSPAHFQCGIYSAYKNEKFETSTSKEPKISHFSQKNLLPFCRHKMHYRFVILLIVKYNWNRINPPLNNVTLWAMDQIKTEHSDTFKTYSCNYNVLQSLKI
jgi:hypothetical protein